MDPSPLAASPRRYLTSREAASRLGVSANALKAWIRADELPALRTPGGHHRIAEEDLARFQRRLGRGAGAGPGPAPRVLVVDDDPLLLATLRAAVEQRLPGVDVDVAADGYEALVQVGRFRPDVLVLDLRMPRLDGLEVCQRLRESPATAGIRILAITAFTEALPRERVLAAGADDFLEKPFDLDAFRARLSALLPRGARR
jgi:excisionase family DNA binding protein